MNNLEVARAWASQSKPCGRSSNGNFHFSGDTLYSYSTPIAKLHTVNGKRVALHWAHEYSITTTSKHRTAMLRAVRGMPEFQVPAFGASGGRKLIGTLCHEINLNELQRAIDDETARLNRARTYKSRDWLEMLERDLAEYRATFGV